MYFLLRLRKFKVSPPVLRTFYSSAVENFLTGCISVWYGSCTAQDQANLQRVVRSAERTIRTSLPTMHDIYHKRMELRARNIMRDDSHPNASLFTLLPSGRCLCSLN